MAAQEDNHAIMQNIWQSPDVLEEEDDNDDELESPEAFLFLQVMRRLEEEHDPTSGDEAVFPVKTILGRYFKKNVVTHYRVEWEFDRDSGRVSESTANVDDIEAHCWHIVQRMKVVVINFTFNFGICFLLETLSSAILHPSCCVTM